MSKNNTTGAFESSVRFKAPGGFTTSPGASGTPLPTNYNSNNQRDFMRNVVPVTVANIWKSEDDEVKVGNSVAHILSLVGKLTFVEKRVANLTYTLDDMTGPPIEVKLWLGFDEKVPDELVCHSKSFPYAQVIAKLRCIQAKRFLHATRILPIKDANDITMHLLEVLHTSMSIQMKEQMMDVTDTILPNPDAANSVFYQSTYLNSANFTTSHAANNSVKGTQTPQSSFKKTEPAAMKGLSIGQQLVLRTIANTKSPIGVGYDHLFSSLKSLNKHVILQTVEFLLNEGHIYNTIDDDHFLTTDDELFQFTADG